MAHIVYVQAKNVRKFNYCKFGSYTGRDGKRVQLLNPDDQPVEGWEMYDPMTSLDIDNKYNRRIYEFLKGHPLVEKGNFVLIDTRAQVEQKAENVLKAADAVQIAAKMSTKEYRDMARLTGVGLHFDDEIIKAKIIQKAAQHPEKFMEIYSDSDKDYKVFLKSAVEKNLVVLVNGVYKHGNYTLGISEAHAIAWLKDNLDVYAVMKNQLRGNVEVKVEDVIETDTSDMKASAGIAALEKEIEAQKNAE